MSFEPIAAALAQCDLLSRFPDQLQQRKAQMSLPKGLYRNSLFARDGILYAMVRTADERRLLILSTAALPPSAFHGDRIQGAGWTALACPLIPENARALRQVFPWLDPISLADRPATIGCGDRLGRATPGHIQAIRRFAVAPVLAQQSMRELTLTRRTFADVLADAVWGVFQEGYTEGYGADADHLKTLADIEKALEAGFTMITLDLSAVLRPEAAAFSEDEVAAAFDRLPEATRKAVLTAYAGREFSLDGETIAFSPSDARRCAVLYTAALDFAREVYDLLLARRGPGRFDLEISIDETTPPTLPSHHLFFIRELRRRGVEIVSLAPRFIGEFQKGIDYLGDRAEFRRQFESHCRIARAHGHYKISVHSGSDKFAIFPIVGEATGGRFHLKTAGTSWLEAVRLAAERAPGLFRAMHDVARRRLPEAQTLYHITPDLDSIPDIRTLPDHQLSKLLEHPAARQVLHVAYGFILEEPSLKRDLYRLLHEDEERHLALLENHFMRHLQALGLPRL